MSWLLTNIISAFMLPPFNLILLGSAGLLVLGRRPRLGKGLIFASLTLLYALSTPFVGNRLLASLETPPPANLASHHEAGTIVVLGGGRYLEAPEYGSDSVGPATLERLRYAVRLQHQTGKPILVTGGKPDSGGLSEAQAMQEALVNDFHTPAAWTEGRSANTYENALFSHQILERKNIATIYLVTHAWHMPRARRVFERAGFRVIPAPTSFTTFGPTSALDFLPSTDGLQHSRTAMHEFIGMLWYRLKS